jgi:hypothetical protein
VLRGLRRFRLFLCPVGCASLAAGPALLRSTARRLTFSARRLLAARAPFAARAAIRFGRHPIFLSVRIPFD